MSSPAISPGLGIKIVQIPSAVQNVPNAGIYILDRLFPSTTVSQRIEISNSTDEIMKVSIYPGSATFTNGIFTPGSFGVSNQLVSWTSVNPSSCVIPAHSNCQPVVTITTPPDAISGMQYGVIWASVQSSAGDNGIVNVNRVGIRMYNPVGEVLVQSSKSPTHHWYQHSAVDFQWMILATLALSIVFLAVKQVLFAKRINKKLRKKVKK